MNGSDAMANHPIEAPAPPFLDKIFIYAGKSLSLALSRGFACARR
jgi:hypothetical protein